MNRLIDFLEACAIVAVLFAIIAVCCALMIFGKR